MSPSLDLLLTHYRHELAELVLRVAPGEAPPPLVLDAEALRSLATKIGRASCRERV